MKLFDLHTDSLTESFKGNSFWAERHGNTRADAIFIPDDVRGDAAVSLFIAMAEHYNSIYPKSHYNSILAVEGGAALGGNAANVERLKRAGVAMLTLCWNGENELGFGCDFDLPLKEFGKKCISLLEDNNITVDVSHLSEAGFWDVADVAKKPFVATHSNCYAVCPFKRNLRDDQIFAIKQSGGLVGITFCDRFIAEDNIGFWQLYAHVEHLLNLGLEDNISIGSDIDGATLPDCINSYEKIEQFYDFLVSQTGTLTADKIFYENAGRFFSEYIT